MKASAHFERCFGFARCEETRARPVFLFLSVSLVG